MLEAAKILTTTPTLSAFSGVVETLLAIVAAAGFELSPAKVGNFDKSVAGFEPTSVAWLAELGPEPPKKLMMRGTSLDPS